MRNKELTETNRVAADEANKRGLMKEQTIKMESDLAIARSTLEAFNIHSNDEIESKESMIMAKREEYNIVSQDLANMKAEYDAFLSRIRG